jgi:hypothetical protein
MHLIEEAEPRLLSWTRLLNLLVLRSWLWVTCKNMLVGFRCLSAICDRLSEAHGRENLYKRLAPVFNGLNWANRGQLNVIDLEILLVNRAVSRAPPTTLSVELSRGRHVKLSAVSSTSHCSPYMWTGCPRSWFCTADIFLDLL